MPNIQSVSLDLEELAVLKKAKTKVVFGLLSQVFKSINPSRYPKIKVAVNKNPFTLNKFLCIENAIKITNQTFIRIRKIIFTRSNNCGLRA